MNQIWDFSAAIDSGSTATQYVLAAGATTYGSLFPTATFAQATVTGADTLYIYEAQSGPDIANAGNYSTINHLPLYFHFPRIFFDLPATYGKVYGHSFNGTSDMGDTITGVDSFVVDGYGTLRLPYRDFSNVLRFRRAHHISSTNQSLNYFYLLDQVEYAFYIPGYHDFLFDIQYQKMVDISGALQLTTNARYAKNVMTGVADMAYDNNFSVSPNPAQNMLHIRLSGNSTEGQAILYNIAGQKVAEQMVSGEGAMATGHLPRGLYTLQVLDASSIMTRKVVLQ